MTEIKNGIFKTISKFINGSSIDAIVEPMINGVWFYFLHKIYKRVNQKQQQEREMEYGI